MDQRYNALADAHGRMASETQRLANENTTLQEVTPCVPPVATKKKRTLPGTRPSQGQHPQAQERRGGERCRRRARCGGGVPSYNMGLGLLTTHVTQVNTVRADNRSLDKMLQQKQSELDALNSRLDSYMVRLVAMDVFSYRKGTT